MGSISMFLSELTTLVPGGNQCLWLWSAYVLNVGFFWNPRRALNHLMGKRRLGAGPCPAIVVEQPGVRDILSAQAISDVDVAEI